MKTFILSLLLVSSAYAEDVMLPGNWRVGCSVPMQNTTPPPQQSKIVVNSIPQQDTKRADHNKRLLKGFVAVSISITIFKW